MGRSSREQGGNFAASEMGRPSRRWLYKVSLVLSLVYCLAAGVLGLGSSAENGIDLAVCYVAGVTALRGFSPYNHTELTNTRRALTPAVAAKPSYPFAYPPSAIPACVLLGLLPWEGAQALWKLLNMAFLIGAVLFTFRIFSGLQFTQNDRYLAWSFAFILSPTVSVLLVGQSSLFVLFAALLTMVLYDLRMPWPAGFSLALALTKPHLTFPLVFLLLFRRRFKLTIIALATFAALAILGLYIGHSRIDTYLQGVSRYASWNSPASPHLVGIPNLITGVFGLPASVATRLSVICGLLLLGITFLLDSKDSSRDRTENVLPLLLLVSVLAFGAHSYDLVFLIPVCIWAIGSRRGDRRFLLIVVLCFILALPLRAVTLAYEKLLSHSMPLLAFRVVIEPFRSWIVLIVFALVLYLTYRRNVTRPPSSPAPAPPPPPPAPVRSTD